MACINYTIYTLSASAFPNIASAISVRTGPGLCIQKKKNIMHGYPRIQFATFLYYIKLSQLLPFIELLNRTSS